MVMSVQELLALTRVRPTVSPTAGSALIAQTAAQSTGIAQTGMGIFKTLSGMREANRQQELQEQGQVGAAQRADEQNALAQHRLGLTQDRLDLDRVGMANKMDATARELEQEQDYGSAVDYRGYSADQRAAASGLPSSVVDQSSSRLEAGRPQMLGPGGTLMTPDWGAAFAGQPAGQPEISPEDSRAHQIGLLEQKAQDQAETLSESVRMAGAGMLGDATQGLVNTGIPLSAGLKMMNPIAQGAMNREAAEDRARMMADSRVQAAGQKVDSHISNKDLKDAVSSGRTTHLDMAKESKILDLRGQLTAAQGVMENLSSDNPADQKIGIKDLVMIWDRRQTDRDVMFFSGEDSMFGRLRTIVSKNFGFGDGDPIDNLDGFVDAIGYNGMTSEWREQLIESMKSSVARSEKYLEKNFQAFQKRYENDVAQRDRLTASGRADNAEFFDFKSREFGNMGEALFGKRYDEGPDLSPPPSGQEIQAGPEPAPSPEPADTAALDALPDFPAGSENWSEEQMETWALQNGYGP